MKAIWVRNATADDKHPDGGVIVRVCGWDGSVAADGRNIHSHIDYWLVPGFVASVGDVLPVEAIRDGFTGGYHFYWRVGDECFDTSAFNSSGELCKAKGGAAEKPKDGSRKEQK